MRHIYRTIEVITFLFLVALMTMAVVYIMPA